MREQLKESKRLAVEKSGTKASLVNQNIAKINRSIDAAKKIYRTQKSKNVDELNTSTFIDDIDDDVVEVTGTQFNSEIISSAKKTKNNTTDLAGQLLEMNITSESAKFDTKSTKDSSWTYFRKVPMMSYPEINLKWPKCTGVILCDLCDKQNVQKWFLQHNFNIDKLKAHLTFAHKLEWNKYFHLMSL